jgi:hypothetical protein
VRHHTTQVTLTKQQTRSKKQRIPESTAGHQLHPAQGAARVQHFGAYSRNSEGYMTEETKKNQDRALN